MSLSYVLTFCRVAIGLVFVWSFVGKVQAISTFIQTINRFKLLPIVLQGPVAGVFLIGELAVSGTMLLGGKLLPWGFLLAGLLLIFFSIALVSVLIRKIQTSCNCFGFREKLISLYDVVRNVFFVLCALVGWQLYLNSDNPRNLINSSMTVVELGLVGLIAFAFVLIMINLNEIIQLFK